jgi:hypothetical protein
MVEGPKVEDRKIEEEAMTMGATKQAQLEQLERPTEPCPFCGTPACCEDGEHEPNSKVVFDPNPRVVNGETYGYAVVCIMCGARGPESKTELEAIQEWNRRK